jgi:hypothetical protein
VTVSRRLRIDHILHGPAPLEPGVRDARARPTVG